MKLYEITNKYLEWEEMSNNTEISEDAILNALEEIEDNFNDKLENIAKYYKNLEASEDGIKKEIERLTNKKRIIEIRKLNLKLYIKNAMETLGKLKVETDLFKFTVAKSKKSIEITDINLLDKQFLKEVEIKADKVKILDYLKNNKLEKIDGIRIVENTSLRIK